MTLLLDQTFQKIAHGSNRSVYLNLSTPHLNALASSGVPDKIRGFGSDLLEPLMIWDQNIFGAASPVIPPSGLLTR